MDHSDAAVFRFRPLQFGVFAVAAIGPVIVFELLGYITAWVAALIAILSVAATLQSTRIKIDHSGVNLGWRGVTPWTHIRFSSNRHGGGLELRTKARSRKVVLALFEKDWHAGEIGKALQRFVPTEHGELREELGLPAGSPLSAPPGYIPFRPLP